MLAAVREALGGGSAVAALVNPFVGVVVGVGALVDILVGVTAVDDGALVGALVDVFVVVTATLVCFTQGCGGTRRSVRAAKFLGRLRGGRPRCSWRHCVEALATIRGVTFVP